MKQRIKSECTPSVYDQLQLPKLRLKQQRQESIYQSLRQLDLSREESKIRTLIDLADNEAYLQQYLKQE